MVYSLIRKESFSIEEASIKHWIDQRSRRFISFFGYGTSIGMFSLVIRHIYKSKRVIFKTILFGTYVWSAVHFHVLGENLGLALSLKKSCDFLY